MIYADNAATTQIDPEAYEIMQEYLKAEYGNPSSLYSFAREGKKALSKARKTIAECINALPEEIYFTSGGSESDNWAIKGTVLYNNEKSCVITSQIEHHAIIRACEQLEHLGFPSPGKRRNNPAGNARKNNILPSSCINNASK